VASTNLNFQIIVALSTRLVQPIKSDISFGRTASRNPGCSSNLGGCTPQTLNEWVKKADVDSGV